MPVRSRPSPDSPGCGRGRQRHRRLGPVPFPCPITRHNLCQSPPLPPSTGATTHKAHPSRAANFAGCQCSAAPWGTFPGTRGGGAAGCMHNAVEKQRPLQGHRHGKRPPRASLRWKWWRGRRRGAPVTLLDGEGGPLATTTGRDRAVSGFSDWRPPLAGSKGAPCHCCLTRGGRLQRAGAVPAPSPPQPPTLNSPAAGATCKEACGAPLTRTAAAPTGNATASRRKHPPARAPWPGARGTAVPLANPTGPARWGVLARLVRFLPLASRGGKRTVRRRRGTLCVSPHGRRAP